LEHFFIDHRKDYQWDYPHYQGAVFHCKNKKTAKAIKKHLKRYDYSLWEEALNELNPVYAESYQMEYGLFQIGKNEYVDKLIFKCGSYESLSDYPYTFVMGKKLKAPESYNDVRDRVLKGYLESQENLWVDALKHKYKVELNEEVLKTVNNSGNK
jgi:peptidyl-prolyl cis-trans isomerase SurA